MSLPTVIMSGPLPPAVGGMASVIGALRDSSLSSRVDLCLFETGKTTPENRPLWQGIATRLALLRRWWKKMGKTPRPVAHIHTCSGFTFFLDGLLLLLARVRSAPTVLHVHGACFDGFLDELSFPMSTMARWLTRRADTVVVLSDDWRKRLANRLPGARLAVVVNGVPSFTGTRQRSSSQAPRYLFLGNLCRRKGVHTLLQAAKDSRIPWELDLAGGEEEPGFMAWTQQQIEHLGLSNRVRALGPVIGEAKNHLLLQADAFVLPSLAEGLPMSLLEAMAARLPVVVTAVGAMPEVVHDGVEGYLIPPEDPTALRDALDRLASSSELRDRMGKAASESCERKYGIERMVDTLIDIYAKLPLESPR
jgi:glycosyltransferase involved in cell wall biosynthesis